MYLYMSLKGCKYEKNEKKLSKWGRIMKSVLIDSFKSVLVLWAYASIFALVALMCD